MRHSNAIRMLTCPVAFCLALGAGGAMADSTVYKYRLPDGRILYTQQRPARGTLLETIRVPSPSPAQVARARRELERDRAFAEQLELDRSRVALAELQVLQARLALKEADAALRYGIVPLPGERKATVSGRSRLTDAYWERQALLRRSADLARQRLDMATGEATGDYEAAGLAGESAADTSGW